MTGDDFAVTAKWGHFGAGNAVMPGRGRVVERACGPEERTTLSEHVAELGGYQVLKKWLSYRELGVLGRRLRAQEVRHFTDTARRIGALLLATSGGSERRPR